MQQKWRELRQKFSVYDPNRLVTVAADELGQLANEVEVLLNSISQTREFKESLGLFDELLLIQELAATLLWKYKVKLPAKLESFVREFDRGDTEEVRKHVFAALKQGSWPE